MQRDIILMEPNGHYMCIVPDGGGKMAAENVFLPFEGDSGLSVILSKALMLTEDDKIMDERITRQIGRKQGDYIRSEGRSETCHYP